MYFQLLQNRLIEALRSCIGNGLLTERGLARSAGVSQPHMHHILKGARALTTQMADRILRTLQITVVDLLERTEVGDAAVWGPAGVGTRERIQILVERTCNAREQALLLVAEEAERPGLNPRPPWPLPGRFPEPGALPPPS